MPEAAKTERLEARLQAAREETDRLFGILDPAALYDRPVAERHRLIFYLGHLEAFDANLILRGALERPAWNSGFDKLFAFGIDPDPGKGPLDQPADWPRENEVRGYSRRIREEIDAASAQVPEQLMHVAIEHRLMHAETLAYLFHNLPVESKRGPRAEGNGSRPPTRNEMMTVPIGIAALGLARGNEFGWDNEFEQHYVQVPEFRITRFKISNADYLVYMSATAVPPPGFWIKHDGRWFLRSMFGEIPLPLDMPVYVTQEEADAYARWRGGALPTEAQYHRAAEGAHAANADFARWDPIAVDAPGGESAHGVAQMVGNGWEWTSTVFAPFAGFERFPFYPGYSADFFDGKHWVMKGGSPRTAACFLRPSFRNWFRADYPYVYAGFHVVSESAS
jgi:formylglycine-generating enzyme required for sulfatase activity